MAVSRIQVAPSDLMARARAARLTAANLLTDGVAGARRSVSVSLPTSATSPGKARRLVGSLMRDLGAGAAKVSAAETVVSELVSNAVVHAYDEPSGVVKLHAALVGGGLMILVSDDGRGPYTPSPKPGLGMGWKIVAQLADQFTILESASGGTHICARIGLNRSPVPARAASRV